MKKILILLLFVVTTSVYVNANDADLFNYDRASIDRNLSELTTIENYLSENPDATFTDLMNMGLLTANGKDFSMDLLSYMGEPPLGVPSFLWGCAFGWVGLLVVYIATDQDKVESKKALWGCAASTVTWVVVYVIYVAAVVNATGL